MRTTIEVGARALGTGISLGLAGSLPAQVLFVDDSAGAGGDGVNWATAYAHLSDALAAAASAGGTITEIRVGVGAYFPDTSDASPSGTGDRFVSFTLVDGVTMTGGWAGFGAANPDDRDPVAFETILSGDLNGDDAGTLNRGENSLHVVRYNHAVGTSAAIDGFTVTAGEANLTFSNGRGGGLLIFGSTGASTFSAIDCTFVDNAATEGAGAYVQQSTATFDGCTFENNRATSRGGGMYRQGPATDPLTITGCTFESNTAFIGGGIDLFNNRPGVTISTSEFHNNSAGFGGGIHALANGMSVESSLFSGNSGTNSGGGIATSSNNLSPTGAIIANCTFVANTGGAGGGVGTISSNSAPVITNGVFWANSDSGGADESAQIDRSSVTTGTGPVVTYSIVDGLTGAGPYAHPTNSGDDPLFADESMGDFRLTLTSPAIDTGDNAAVSGGFGAVDLDGGARIVDGDGDTLVIVDMGAYEFVVIDSDSDGLDDGDELAIGTDPFDPDTDDDGLLDGTEVDSADGSGCPDPLNPDSDGDGLLDGEEVLFMTSPCSADTDGDGVPDLEDPTPTEPGVTQEFLEAEARATADSIDALSLALFTGPNNNANRGRRNSMSSRVQRAASLIAKGDDAAALGLLQSVLNKTDGEPSPNDWIEAGPEQETLEAEILLLISLLVI